MNIDIGLLFQVLQFIIPAGIGAGALQLVRWLLDSSNRKRSLDLEEEKQEQSQELAKRQFEYDMMKAIADRVESDLKTLQQEQANTSATLQQLHRENAVLQGEKTTLEGRLATMEGVVLASQAEVRSWKDQEVRHRQIETENYQLQQQLMKAEWRAQHFVREYEKDLEETRRWITSLHQENRRLRKQLGEDLGDTKELPPLIIHQKRENPMDYLMARDEEKPLTFIDEDRENDD